jgi:hypothetical protein
MIKDRSGTGRFRMAIFETEWVKKRFGMWEEM